MMPGELAWKLHTVITTFIEGSSLYLYSMDSTHVLCI